MKITRRTLRAWQKAAQGSIPWVASPPPSVRAWQDDVLKDVHWVYIPASGAKWNVVVIHGYRDCHDSLGAMIEYFTNAQCNVITCDLPGHGASENGHPGYFRSMCHLKDVNYALFLKMWEQERLPSLFVGYSLGALIELLLLTDRRVLRNRLVKGVVSVSAPVDVTGTAQRHFYGQQLGLACMSLTCGGRYVPATFIGQKQRESMLMPSSGSWCYRGPIPWRVAHEFLRHTKLLQKQIALLDSVPILAFQGTEDSTSGYPAAREILNSLRETKFCELEGVGHAIWHDNSLTQDIIEKTDEWLAERTRSLVQHAVS